jgi:hypothetical protein
MKTHTNDLLKIEVDEKKDSIILKWTGKSTAREPGNFIIPILTDAMKKAGEKIPVILDFSGLEYMNSSTMTPVSKILEKAKSGESRIIIHYRKEVNWQELNFSALKIFETKDKRIEITGL